MPMYHVTYGDIKKKITVKDRKDLFEEIEKVFDISMDDNLLEMPDKDFKDDWVTVDNSSDITADKAKLRLIKKGILLGCS